MPSKQRNAAAPPSQNYSDLEEFSKEIDKLFPDRNRKRDAVNNTDFSTLQGTEVKRGAFHFQKSPYEDKYGDIFRGDFSRFKSVVLQTPEEDRGEMVQLLKGLKGNKKSNNFFAAFNASLKDGQPTIYPDKNKNKLRLEFGKGYTPAFLNTLHIAEHWSNNDHAIPKELDGIFVKSNDKENYHTQVDHEHAAKRFRKGAKAAITAFPKYDHDTVTVKGDHPLAAEDISGIKGVASDQYIRFEKTGDTISAALYDDDYQPPGFPSPQETAVSLLVRNLKEKSALDESAEKSSNSSASMYSQESHDELAEKSSISSASTYSQKSKYARTLGDFQESQFVRRPGDGSVRNDIDKRNPESGSYEAITDYLLAEKTAREKDEQFSVTDNRGMPKPEPKSTSHPNGKGKRQSTNKWRKARADAEAAKGNPSTVNVAVGNEGNQLDNPVSAFFPIINDPTQSGKLENVAKALITIANDQETQSNPVARESASFALGEIFKMKDRAPEASRIAAWGLHGFPKSRDDAAETEAVGISVDKYVQDVLRENLTSNEIRSMRNVEGLSPDATVPPPTHGSPKLLNILKNANAAVSNWAIKKGNQELQPASPLSPEITVQPRYGDSSVSSRTTEKGNQELQPANRLSPEITKQSRDSLAVGLLKKAAVAGKTLFDKTKSVNRSR